MHHVYFDKSLKNGKVYIGSTSNTPVERITQHNSGTSIWTKQNRPFKLIYYESYICKEDSKLREIFYKTGIGRKIKKAIIESLDP